MVVFLILKLFSSISVLVVSNFLSSLHYTTQFTAVLPQQGDLDISLTNHKHSLPVCIPREFKAAGSSDVPVFVAEEILFKASMGAEYNLTFHWSVAANGSDHVTYWERHLTCNEGPCLYSLQVRLVITNTTPVCFLVQLSIKHCQMSRISVQQENLDNI